MKSKLIITLEVVFIFLMANRCRAQIVFSEIMYDVSTNEYHDEFIEIFNTSYLDSVEISGWSFSDSSGTDIILPHRGGSKIAPRHFALILDGSYFGNSDTYDSLFVDSLVILKIGDKSFGKNGLSNSVPEWLTLQDSTGDIVAKHRYSIGNIPGHSDEKINLDELSDSLNWEDSKWLGGTPGKKNSVSPPTYDYGFKENSFIFPVILIASETITFSFELVDFGEKTILDSIEILVFSDQNSDVHYQTDDLLIAHQKLVVLPEFVIIEWQFPPAGEHHIVAQLIAAKDEIPENDKMTKWIRVLERNISLHINEIKFLTDTDEPEWIEIINTGSESVLLKDWAVTDHSDTAVIDSHMHIKPGQFLVFGEKSLPDYYQLDMNKFIILSKFPTLNDQEDEILFLNPSGNWIEKINYNRKWLEGEDYRYPSLEKINPLLYENVPENWGPCTHGDGATPGYENSIFSKIEIKQSELSASPNPFSPDQDGFDDVTIISGTIPESSSRIKAEIYDTRGRLIRVLKDNRFSGSHFNLVWDGKDGSGRMARIGIYIIFFQALNDRLGIIRELKTTVVLAQNL